MATDLLPSVESINEFIEKDFIVGRFPEGEECAEARHQPGTSSRLEVTARGNGSSKDKQQR